MDRYSPCQGVVQPLAGAAADSFRQRFTRRSPCSCAARGRDILRLLVGSSPMSVSDRLDSAQGTCLMAPALGVAGWAEVRLRDNGYLVLKKVSCEYREGVLTLRGRLPSYYLKQVAQEAVARVAGV